MSANTSQQDNTRIGCYAFIFLKNISAHCPVLGVWRRQYYQPLCRNRWPRYLTHPPCKCYGPGSSQIDRNDIFLWICALHFIYALSIHRKATFQTEGRQHGGVYPVALPRNQYSLESNAIQLNRSRFFSILSVKIRQLERQCREDSLELIIGSWDAQLYNHSFLSSPIFVHLWEY